MHFRLAYEPGNFKRAVQEYRKWERKLAEHDWPFCFGTPKNPPPAPKLEDKIQEAPPLTEFDEFIRSRNGNGTHNNEEKKMEVDEGGEDGSNTVAIKAVNELEQQQQEVKLDDLDLTDVPKSWHDILRVDDSTIPHLSLIHI